MADSNNRTSGVQDPSLTATQAIEQVDLKRLSYKQLRRLYAIVMRVVDDVNEELTVRADEDDAGDTVRVPVPSAAD